MIQAPKGTYDVLPVDQPLRQLVTDEFERLCALYAYRKIQTPVFEDTELFARTSGAGSDVVQKEMYTFADRSDRSLIVATPWSATTTAITANSARRLRTKLPRDVGMLIPWPPDPPDSRALPGSPGAVP